MYSTVPTVTLYASHSDCSNRDHYSLERTYQSTDISTNFSASFTNIQFVIEYISQNGTSKESCKSTTSRRRPVVHAVSTARPRWWSVELASHVITTLIFVLVHGCKCLTCIILSPFYLSTEKVSRFHELQNKTGNEIRQGCSRL